MFITITARLGNMRKPQEFVVATKYEWEGTARKPVSFVLQSDKSIGKFSADTGEGVLNTKGCYFPHLNAFTGASPYTLPSDILNEVLSKI